MAQDPRQDDKTPEWVLARIREAKAQSSGTLVLNGLHRERLNHIPPEIQDLGDLQSLDLRYNFITAIPEWLGQLTHLTSLDVGFTQISDLPAWPGVGLGHMSSTSFGWWPDRCRRLSYLPLFLQNLNQVAPQLSVGEAPMGKRG